MRSLRDRLADVPQVGRVEWIGVRPAHGEAIEEREQVDVIATRGIDGDVAAAGRVGGKRQVTLIQAEHLPVIAALAGARVTASMLRRNLVVSGVNLLSLGRLPFRVGAGVVLRATGSCAPCALMDEVIGPGAFHAMRGHGGITAAIEIGGVIRRGDPVQLLGAPDRG